MAEDIKTVLEELKKVSKDLGDFKLEMNSKYGKIMTDKQYIKEGDTIEFEGNKYVKTAVEIVDKARQTLLDAAKKEQETLNKNMKSFFESFSNFTKKDSDSTTESTKTIAERRAEIDAELQKEGK